jgi:hypothetical protein
MVNSNAARIARIDTVVDVAPLTPKIVNSTVYATRPESANTSPCAKLISWRMP